ncbi:MAG: hypothetical protein KatS3mg057_1123 [Herpetosiphonaceae bacterium]|nr:MAG: hypothetical protein KatS3mg057_1123 [Herpetosiphonaceae bacterium]
MRFRRKEVVHATLMFSAAGVMVDATSHHLFSDASPDPGPHHQEIEPPRGAAVVAVQFVHTVGESFANLQIFRLSYFLPAAPEGFWEMYLAPQGSDLRMRAVPVGPESLNKDQRRVLATLLSGSDPHAWQSSPDFRRALEK